METGIRLNEIRDGIIKNNPIKAKIFTLMGNRPIEKYITYVYEKGKCVWQGSDADTIPSEYKDLVSEKVVDKETHGAELKDYSVKLDKLYTEAYDNFAQYMGWQDIDASIADWIKYKCYEDCHGSGYQWIMACASEYNELIELIRNSNNERI